MTGYAGWRDVRNDLLLLLAATKLWLAGYVALDWALYPTQGSHVLYVLLRHLGSDSLVYRWAVQFWNHGLWR